MSIAAVVVTYNRKELLCKNLEMLFLQNYKIDKIVIVDNHSTDGTREYICDEFLDKIEQIQYEFLDENIGGAGGFEYGCKFAYENGYDYVWLMDDDGRPENENTLNEIMKIVEKQKDEFLVVNSLVTQDLVNLSFGLITPKDTIESVKVHSVDGVYKGKINAFNGTLVSKSVFETIGFPNGQFFIKGDERDFTDRAKSAGAYVATAVKSIYLHPEEPLKKQKLFGRTIMSNIEVPWKEYYKMRNYTYMKKRDYGTGRCVIDFIKDIIRVLVSDSKNKKKDIIKMMIKGFRDGYRGKLGATVRP
jgi:GT2 family glycosyltransferase